MNEFTKLNVTCLNDMQMLLDGIANTIFKINTVLSIERNKISKYLKEHLPAGFKLEEWNNEIEVFSLDDSEDKLLLSDLDITYSTTINKVIKRDSINCFDLLIGYVSDKRQNVIYIQLFDNSETPILTEGYISELKENISEEWMCDSDDNSEEPNIYIEFSIDDNFTIEKIKNCIQVFKNAILQPIINKLEQ